MLTITRKLAEQLNKVFPRALSLTPHSPMPSVEFAGGPQGLRIRCHTREATAEFRLDGGQPGETILAPWSLLLDSGESGDSGRERMVELRRENGRVLAAWRNGRVPRVVQYDAPAGHDCPWPDSPETFAENSPELLKAFADAAATTDNGSSGYALDCLQLCGGDGKIVATDGRQLLVQAGFEFPWEADLLVPASRVSGAAELETDGPVLVGRTDDWFVLQAGRWTFGSRIHQQGSFPQVERHLPDPAAAITRLELSPSDRAFLAENLPHLPGDDIPFAPVTLDVNGSVAVRARGPARPHVQEAAAGMELVLTGTGRTGEPIRISMDRRFLTRAANLGFLRIRLFGDRQPVLAWDDRRRYVWAVLDNTACIPATDEMIRIDSPAPSVVPRADSPFPCPPPSNERSPRRLMANPSTFPSDSREKSTGKKSTRNHRSGTPCAARAAHPPGNGRARTATGITDMPGAVDQMIALRTTLQEAAAAAAALVRQLKAERRQTRQLRSALASLREIPPLTV